MRSPWLRPTASDSRASFSTYGDFVDVAAPGVSVLSTLMSGGYGGMSGTSMATPHVAGLAALLFSLNPRLTNAQVRELIETNVDDLGTAGWDPYFGNGRINARKALDACPRRPADAASAVERVAGRLPGSDRRWRFRGGAGELAGQTVHGQSIRTRAYAGTGAAHFTGGPNAAGALTRPLRLVPATGACRRRLRSGLRIASRTRIAGGGAHPRRRMTIG